jgi:hypothetical protein
MIMADHASGLRRVEADEYPYGPQPAVIAVVDRGDEGEQSETWLLLGPGKKRIIAGICVGIFFAGANLVVCPLMAASGGPANDWRQLPIFALFGAVLAESGLLSAWLVFSSSSFWFRAAGCWAAAFVLWVCWAGGLLLASRMASWQIEQEMQLGSLSLPLVALAIQSPLWFARSYSGWRLVNRETGPPRRSPLSIRDYLVGTAIAAISITFARLARPVSFSPDNYWAGWSIAFVFFACGGLLAIVPAMLLIFRVRNWRLGFGLLILYSLIFGIVVAGILDATNPGRSSAFDYVALITMFTSLAAFLGAGVVVARYCDYSLSIGRVTDK